MDVPTYTAADAPVPDGVVVLERASTSQDLGPKLNRTAADVVRGRRCQAYPAVKPELMLASATWDEPTPECDNACVDGNFVTAAAWPAHPALLREFLRLLGTPVGK